MRKMTNSNQGQRAVIVHYHLFKCAGTSVEHTLEKCFGKKLLRIDQDVPFGKIFAKDLLVELKENHQIMAVTSHQLKMPLPKLENFQFLPIVFLRHPIDRIQSVYNFDKRRGPVTPDAKVAVENDFANYLRIQIDNDKQVKDFYVRSLTDAWDLDTGTKSLLPIGLDEHFSRAFEVLKSLPVVGVVEEFSKSAKTFEIWISKYLPEFSFSVSRQNVDPSRLSNLEDRLQRVREEIGDEIFEELVEVNSYDFRLYEAAKDHLSSVEQKFRLKND